MYSRKWTNFETQSVAFGTLRKAMYPKYLVRWFDDGLIHILLPTADINNPELLLKIKVTASQSKTDSSVSVTKTGKETLMNIVGGDKAYQIVDLVQDALRAS